MPIRVNFLNQIGFVFSFPGFHPFFTDYRVSDIVMGFIIDHCFQVVSFSKAFDHSLNVFGYPSLDVSRDTDVKRAVPLIGQYVNIG